MARPRRGRAGTVDSVTSVGSFVSQSEEQRGGMYRRVSSRSPSRERQALMGDGWEAVEEYY